VKPQSARRGLDARDASPHPSGMGDNDKTPKAQPSSREAKLAQALRANLRRRKASGESKPAEKPDKPD